MTKEQAVKNIVKEIESDLTDRCGLGNEWDQIDNSTKKEIRAEWAEIVKKNLEAIS